MSHKIQMLDLITEKLSIVILRLTHANARGMRIPSRKV
jgi:hypothetical protein